MELCEKCGSKTILAVTGVGYFEPADSIGSSIQTSEVSVGIHWCPKCKNIKDVWIEEPMEKDLRDKQLQAELAKHRWIPVSERLPEETIVAVVYAKHLAFEPMLHLADFTPSIGHFVFRDWDVWEVTHWKPIILPKEAPDGKEDTKP